MIAFITAGGQKCPRRAIAHEIRRMRERADTYRLHTALPGNALSRQQPLAARPHRESWPSGMNQKCHAIPFWAFIV
jgi:hypothetical protein